MRVKITVTTDNGADVTVERSRVEHSHVTGPEVDLRALDALLTVAVAEVRAAYGVSDDTQATTATEAGL